MFPISIARPGRLLLGATLVALLLSAVVVGLGNQQDRQFDELVASGTRALRQGDTSGALEALSGALTLNPDSVVAHLRRAEAHAARQDFGPALRDLTAAARLDPGATTPRKLLGDVNYALGRYRQAESRYREFLALDERSAEVWHKLGLTQLLSGQPREALQSLRQALAIEGRRAETSYVLGLVLLDLKRTPEAIEELRRAVALRPSLKEARVELARQFGRTGRAADEVAQLEALAVLEPQVVTHRVALAQALLRGGLTEAALTSLARARQQFPDNGVLEWALGEAWLGEYERSHDHAMLNRAEAALERAAEVWSHTEVRVSRARTHLLAGRPQPALRLLVEAAQTYPVSPRTLRLLAEAARRTGESAVEYDALAKAVILENAPADPGVTIQGYLRLAELATDLGRPTAERWLGDAAAAASAIDGALPRVQAVRKRLAR
jgi:tetratricopeptide (TPR) repeat protein